MIAAARNPSRPSIEEAASASTAADESLSAAERSLEAARNAVRLAREGLDLAERHASETSRALTEANEAASAAETAWSKTQTTAAWPRVGASRDLAAQAELRHRSASVALDTARADLASAEARERAAVAERARFAAVAERSRLVAEGLRADQHAANEAEAERAGRLARVTAYAREKRAAIEAKAVDAVTKHVAHYLGALTDLQGVYCALTLALGSVREDVEALKASHGNVARAELAGLEVSNPADLLGLAVALDNRGADVGHRSPRGMLAAPAARVTERDRKTLCDVIGVAPEVDTRTIADVIESDIKAVADIHGMPGLHAAWGEFQRGIERPGASLGFVALRTVAAVLGVAVEAAHGAANQALRGDASDVDAVLSCIDLAGRIASRARAL